MATISASARRAPKQSGRSRALGTLAMLLFATLAVSSRPSCCIPAAAPSGASIEMADCCAGGSGACPMSLVSGNAERRVVLPARTAGVCDAALSTAPQLNRPARMAAHSPVNRPSTSAFRPEVSPPLLV